MTVGELEQDDSRVFLPSTPDVVTTSALENVLGHDVLLYRTRYAAVQFCRIADIRSPPPWSNRSKVVQLLDLAVAVSVFDEFVSAP